MITGVFIRGVNSTVHFYCVILIQTPYVWDVDYHRNALYGVEWFRNKVIDNTNICFFYVLRTDGYQYYGNWACHFELTVYDSPWLYS